jgi:hypothetical protein
VRGRPRLRRHFSGHKTCPQAGAHGSERSGAARWRAVAASLLQPDGWFWCGLPPPGALRRCTGHRARCAAEAADTPTVLQICGRCRGARYDCGGTELSRTLRSRSTPVSELRRADRRLEPVLCSLPGRPAASRCLQARASSTPGGRYLVPDLWDMRVHSSSDRITLETMLPMYVANRVTGVRDMHADCFTCARDRRARPRRRAAAAGAWRRPHQDVRHAARPRRRAGRRAGRSRQRSTGIMERRQMT